MNLDDESLLEELDDLIPETKASYVPWFATAGSPTFFDDAMTKKSLSEFRKEYEGTFAIDDEKVEHTKIKIADISPLTFSNDIVTNSYVDSQISAASITEQLSTTMVKEIDERITKQLANASYGQVAAYAAYMPSHSHAMYNSPGIDFGSEHAHTNYMGTAAGPGGKITFVPDTTSDITITNGDNKIEISATGEVKLSGPANISAQAHLFWDQISKCAPQNPQTVARLEEEVEYLKRELDTYKSPMTAMDERLHEIEKIKIQLAELSCSPPPIVLPKSQLEDLEYFQGKITAATGIPACFLSNSSDSKENILLKSQTDINENGIYEVSEPKDTKLEEAISDNFEHAMGLVK